MNNASQNIVIHKNIRQKESFSFVEVIPPFLESTPDYFLGIDSSYNVIWGKIPAVEIPKFPQLIQGSGINIIRKDGKIEIECTLDFNVIEDNKIKGTDIYYKDGKIGISREPLHNYKFDIAVPENTLMTAFHVGDGQYGFSMGNGTSQGFIPEIIGMGSDENDAGLYFLGKAGNNLESDIPLIIMDGRSVTNSSLKNRPIFGITSGDYTTYKMLVDHEGRLGLGRIPEIYKMEVQGTIKADDLVLGDLSVKALIDVIKEHQEEIDNLKNIIESLIEQK